ncbi:WecB/TagA/CpsF family glycosyltransferase [Fulvivirga maritima]|uniref:WecB/TagA/CpsF family glycosyltransferase n=1 Tax=Fulvivirga maritima TaxID=2904247 RepID=UPI001F3CCEAF|nr:WecB/TagA/CpsF family glycosyltransferase [Fulvivirga maritima]UII27945.1 WecB/TagA/CpsF family glycosyltransferase [Fulvivirga maritima]
MTEKIICRGIEHVNIGPIKVSNVNYEIMLECIDNAIFSDDKLTIVYANANTLNRASSDSLFCDSINEADIVHPDGIGVFSASKVLKMPLRERFNWTDYGFDFLEECNERGWKIFFLGSTTERLNKALVELEFLYPGLQIVGCKNGYEDVDDPKIFKEINECSPDILWVGMGSPKQEIWIYKNIDKLNCNVVQAVGDLYALFSGEKPRGSRAIRKLGLEWMVRLFHDPRKYWKRTVIGIPKFIRNVIKLKINKSL